MAFGNFSFLSANRVPVKNSSTFTENRINPSSVAKMCDSQQNTVEKEQDTSILKMSDVSKVSSFEVSTNEQMLPCYLKGILQYLDSSPDLQLILAKIASSDSCKSQFCKKFFMEMKSKKICVALSLLRNHLCEVEEVPILSKSEVSDGKEVEPNTLSILNSESNPKVFSPVMKSLPCYFNAICKYLEQTPSSVGILLKMLSSGSCRKLLCKNLYKSLLQETKEIKILLSAIRSHVCEASVHSNVKIPDDNKYIKPFIAWKSKTVTSIKANAKRTFDEIQDNDKDIKSSNMLPFSEDTGFTRNFINIKDNSPVKGLYNLGNTCYFNAIIQCLAQTPKFLEKLLELAEISEDLYNICEPLIFTLREIKLGGTSLKPVRLLHSFRERAPEFKSELLQQHDCQEFLHSLLSPIHDEMTTILGGKLISRLNCKECDQTSDNLEAFINLSLPVTFEHDKNEISIKDCFDQFTKAELLTDVCCEKCSSNQSEDGASKKVYTNFSKQYLISEPPSVLVLQLNRFQFNFDGVSKYRDTVSFPLELDITPYRKENIELKYELYAIVEHIGVTKEKGHYASYVKIEDTWYLIDDETVYKVDETEALESEAYVLFYKS